MNSKVVVLLTILQTAHEPRHVDLASQGIDFKRMLDRHVRFSLLAKKSSNQWSWLIAQRVSSEVVGNREDNQWMKRGLED